MSSPYAGADTFHNSINELDDSNEPSAADFNTSIAEPHQDSLKYLKNRGAAKEVQYTQSQISGLSAGDVVGVTTGTGSFQDLSSSNGLTSHVDFADCKVGDVIEVFWNAGMSCSGGAGLAEVRLTKVEDFGGAAVTAAIPGAASTVQDVADFPLDRVSMHGTIQIATAGPLRIKIQGKTAGSGMGHNVGVLQGEYYRFTAIRHRPF